MLVSEEEAIELSVDSPVLGMLQELLVFLVLPGREYSNEAVFVIPCRLLHQIDYGLSGLHLKLLDNNE
jgi:hypothetical protein